MATLTARRTAAGLAPSRDRVGLRLAVRYEQKDWIDGCRKQLMRCKSTHIYVISQRPLFGMSARA
jgi:hypothetical protein